MNGSGKMCVEDEVALMLACFFAKKKRVEGTLGEPTRTSLNALLRERGMTRDFIRPSRRVRKPE